MHQADELQSHMTYCVQSQLQHSVADLAHFVLIETTVITAKEERNTN